MNPVELNQYLNKLLAIINDEKQDFFERSQANQEFLIICRFLRKFLPGYMTDISFDSWRSANKFYVEISQTDTKSTKVNGK